MSKLKLYEAALENLAANGNQQAKDVLDLAAKQPVVKAPDTPLIVSNIRGAIANCSEALRLNGDGWDHDTDGELREAIDHLTLALAHLPAL